MSASRKKIPSEQQQKKHADLSDLFLDKLTDFTSEMVNKNYGQGKGMCISAIQIAAINFLGSVTMANLGTISNLSQQLDFINTVKEDVMAVCEQMKLKLKTVDLH